MAGVLREADAAMNLKLHSGASLPTAEAEAEEDHTDAGDAAGETAPAPPELLEVEGATIRSIRIPKEIDAVKAFHARLKQVDHGATQFSRRIKKPLPPRQPAERPAPLVGGFTTEADAHGY